MILTAAMTGLRQSELLGLRWRDVDWAAQRIRVRNAYVRGEHSSEGKSDLSTRRSVPMADRLARELDRWSRRTLHTAPSDLVFAHPQTGNPLDRSKVTKRFKAACVDAGVRVDPLPRPAPHVRDAARRLRRSRCGRSRSSSATPTRRRRRSTRTTRRRAHEVEMVNAAFADEQPPPSGSKPSAAPRSAAVSEPMSLVRTATPEGHEIVLTAIRWAKIVEGHPETLDHLETILQTVSDPTTVNPTPVRARADLPPRRAGALDESRHRRRTDHHRLRTDQRSGLRP